MKRVEGPGDGKVSSLPLSRSSLDLSSSIQAYSAAPPNEIRKRARVVCLRSSLSPLCCRLPTRPVHCLGTTFHYPRFLRERSDSSRTRGDDYKDIVRRMSSVGKGSLFPSSVRRCGPRTDRRRQSQAVSREGVRKAKWKEKRIGKDGWRRSGKKNRRIEVKQSDVH